MQEALDAVSYPVEDLAVDPQSADYDTVVETLPASNDPTFTALSADGTTLFVANNEDATISVLDVSAYP